MASRRKSRELAVQGLYQIDLTQQDPERVLGFGWYEKKIDEIDKEYAKVLIKGVVKNWETLDKIIKTYSINWDFERISIINRCILRLSIYSLINLRDTPPKVVINEAIELTRTFEVEKSVGFINGILNAIYKDEQIGQSGE
jgi:transcription antitermination protein NusB